MRGLFLMADILRIHMWKYKKLELTSWIITQSMVQLYCSLSMLYRENQTKFRSQNFYLHSGGRFGTVAIYIERGLLTFLERRWPISYTCDWLERGKLRVDRLLCRTSRHRRFTGQRVQKVAHFALGPSAEKPGGRRDTGSRAMGQRVLRWARGKDD